MAPALTDRTPTVAQLRRYGSSPATEPGPALCAAAADLPIPTDPLTDAVTMAAGCISDRWRRLWKSGDRAGAYAVALSDTYAISDRVTSEGDTAHRIYELLHTELVAMRERAREAA